MSVTFITPQALVTNNDSSWNDLDVSAYVPAGSTGVILKVRKTTVGSADFGVRNNNSTDSIVETITNYIQVWVCIGIDDNSIFEYNAAAGIGFALIGYFGSESTFFVNEVAKSLSSTGSWQDIDISASTGSDTALAAIFHLRLQAGGGWNYGLRCNNSTDNRTNQSNGHRAYSAIIGVDGSEVCEGYIGHTDHDFYLTGYIKSSVNINVNAINDSLTSTGDYYDIDTGSNISGCSIEIVTTVNSDAIDIRPNGASYAQYYNVDVHVFGLTGVDADGVYEGKIANTRDDFFRIATFVSSVTYNQSASDSLSLADGISNKSASLSKPDTISLVDLLHRSYSSSYLHDSLGLSDVMSMNGRVSASDTISLVDSIGHALNRVLSSTLLLFDNLRKGIPVYAFDTINFYENLIRVNNLSKNENLSIVDAIAYCKELITGYIKRIAYQDTLLLSDSLLPFTINIKPSDAIEIIDVIAEMCLHSPLVRNILLGDNIEISDFIIKDLRKYVSSNVSLIDNFLSKIFSKRISSTQSLVDSLSKEVYSRLSDMQLISDSAVTGYINHLSLADSQTIIDALSKDVRKAISDIIALAGVIQYKQSSIALGAPPGHLPGPTIDIFALSDNTRFLMSTFKYDSVVLTEEESKTFKSTKSSSLPLSDGITTRTVKKSRTDIVTFVSRFFRKVTSEALILSDNVLRSTNKYKFDVINLYEIFAKGAFTKANSDSILISTSLLRLFAKKNIDNLDILESISKRFSRHPLADHEDIIDLLGRLFPQGFSDSILLSDSSTHSFIKNIIDSIVPVDSIIRKESRKILRAPVALVDALRKQVNKLLHKDEEIVDSADIDEFDAAPTPVRRREPVAKQEPEEEWHDVTSIQRRFKK